MGGILPIAPVLAGIVLAERSATWILMQGGREDGLPSEGVQPLAVDQATGDVRGRHLRRAGPYRDGRSDLELGAGFVSAVSLMLMLLDFLFDLFGGFFDGLTGLFNILLDLVADFFRFV